MSNLHRRGLSSLPRKIFPGLFLTWSGLVTRTFFNSSADFRWFFTSTFIILTMSRPLSPTSITEFMERPSKRIRPTLMRTDTQPDHRPPSHPSSATTNLIAPIFKLAYPYRVRPMPRWMDQDLVLPLMLHRQKIIVGCRGYLLKGPALVRIKSFKELPQNNTPTYCIVLEATRNFDPSTLGQTPFSEFTTIGFN